MHVTDPALFGPSLVFALGVWVHLAGQSAKKLERERQEKIDRTAAGSEETKRADQWKADAEMWRLRAKEQEKEIEYRNKRLIEFGVSGYEEMFVLMEVPGTVAILKRRRSVYLKKHPPIPE